MQVLEATPTQSFASSLSPTVEPSRHDTIRRASSVVNVGASSASAGKALRTSNRVAMRNMKTSSMGRDTGNQPARIGEIFPVQQQDHRPHRHPDRQPAGHEPGHHWYGEIIGAN